jgi:hypothetical protein
LLGGDDDCRRGGGQRFGVAAGLIYLRFREGCRGEKDEREDEVVFHGRGMEREIQAK